RSKFQSAIQNQFSLRVVAAAKINLSQVVQDLESFRLQRVGFLEFKLGGAILLLRSQKRSQRRMEFHIFAVLSGHLRREFQALSGSSSTQVRATEVSGQNSKDVELHSTLGALLGSEKQY